MKTIGREDILNTLLRLQERKFYKSGGVWVSKALSRTMTLGNAARDRGEWEVAARYFREAVGIDGTLPHIWIQLGHALSELGDHEQGLEAYRTALSLDPANGECYLHIGRRHVDGGNFENAIEAYKSALAFKGVFSSAKQELTKLRPSFGAFWQKKEAIAADICPRAAQDRHRIKSSEVSFCFDVSDLITHFRYGKFPTGIQRVQIEVVAEAMATSASRTEIFFFIDGMEHFIYLDHSTFTLLTTLCKGDDQEAWMAARDGFFSRIPFCLPYLPPYGAIVVNLGTSWWMYNYFLAIRNLKRERDIIFISYVHDLIPTIKPQYCVEGVTIDYNTWLVGIFFHADAFITNSMSTTRDLTYVAHVMGHPLNERNIATIPLNASFSENDEGQGQPSGALVRKWGLQAEGYVLFVSTIEARKNHEAAFLAWQALLQKNGAHAVPPLVCVGKFGWLNDRAMSVIAADSSLGGKIVFIQRASDLELKSLYKNSLFTIYPSHYEGWGLPITESLSYGRVPLVADNSSLVEAAAGYGVVFESGNVTDFVEKAEKLLFDTKFRTDQEQKIAQQYRLTTWQAMANEIVAFSDKVKTGRRSLYEDFPKSLAGRYVPLNLHRDRSIWRGIASGEMYRIGEGWLWPDPGGCRIKPGSARICIPNLGFPIARIFLRLRGLDLKPASFSIHTEAGLVFSSKTNSREDTWAVFDVEIDRDGCVYFDIRSVDYETIVMNHGGSAKYYSAGIAVLGFCASDRDEYSDRLDFLEAMASNTMENVNAFAKNHVHCWI